MKYFKNLETSSIYRAEETTFSNGISTLSLERWNWDFENWNGHIHDHDKTRKQLKEGIVIVPISKEKALESIKK